MTSPSAGPPTPGAGNKTCPLCGGSYSGDLRFCPVDGQALRDVAASDPLIGTFVAKRYLVERKLGEGGMGAVYEALQVTMDRKVALKVLHLTRLESDKDAMLRFSREASNASKIIHLNVASVFDFSVSPEEGIAYLAMELVDGESLGALVAREGTLHPRRAAAITYQIADALAAAHEHGLIHRDLKPDNVMLTRRPDGSDLVKVVDFGISRVMGSETQRVTSTGLAIGTPAYMSPEQLEAGTIDARTDIFALGLICYRMLAGDLPWPTDDRDRLYTQRLVRPRRPLAEIRPDIAWPEDLQRVLDAAIAIEAEQRYPSALGMALDFVTVIQRWIPDDPQATVPWNRRLRLATPAGMSRIFAPEPQGATGATGAATPGGGAGGWTGPSVASSATGSTAGGGPGTGARALTQPSAPGVAPATAEASTSPARNRTPLMAAGAVAAIAVVAFLAWRMAPGSQTGATEAMTPVGQAPPVTADSSQLAARPDGGGDTTASSAPGGTPAPVTAPVDPSGASGATARRAGEQGGTRVAPAGAGTDRPAPPAVTPEVPPPTAEAAPKLSRTEIRDALERMSTLTGPSSSAGDARSALRLMERILPGADDPRDVVELKLRGAEAHLLLDEPGEACRLLLSIERAAAATARRANVAAYLNDPELNCRGR